MKRIFLIVLDSCGAGAMPDAEKFGDYGVHTLKSCFSSGKLDIPNLRGYGMGNIEGLGFLGAVPAPAGAYAKMSELSMGKDTTIGHWEISGIVSENPLPTYPDGFPEEVLAPFREATGRGVLANAPWSGTEVLDKYGQQHVESGDLIVYTSADSVFQIAAHEDVVPPELLYEYCRTARKILRGKHGVGRVIARPFVGNAKDGFTRTSNRHDFSLEPPQETMLDAIKAAGLASLGVGKIHDIFAGIGLTEYVYTQGNVDGMNKSMEMAKRDFRGLCFINLVDFDMLYGHRRNIDGYAMALSAFDAWLPSFMEQMGEDDLVMITADHGCDPAYTRTTDHTREYIPLVIAGKKVKPVNLGVRGSFADIAATVTQLLGVSYQTQGKSFADEIL
ncbi:MAG: phosphopentomutase [Oscillospiraceae bacterium]|jgi:phosphopentomutase|nr:phosphopentomutase [Oscillospiraceae bacterium]